MFACYMPQPLYPHVINANSEWTGCCEFVGTVRVASERRKTCEDYRVFRCKPYNCFRYSGTIYWTTRRHKQKAVVFPLNTLITSRPFLLVTAPQSAQCASYLSCPGFSSKAIVRQWIALTRVGGGKMEGLGGEMRYGWLMRHKGGLRKWEGCGNKKGRTGWYCMNKKNGVDRFNRLQEWRNSTHAQSHDMTHYVGLYCFHLHIDLITRPFLDSVTLRILKQFAPEDIQFITHRTDRHM